MSGWQPKVGGWIAWKKARVTKLTRTVLDVTEVTECVQPLVSAEERDRRCEEECEVDFEKFHPVLGDRLRIKRESR